MNGNWYDTELQKALNDRNHLMGLLDANVDLLMCTHELVAMLVWVVNWLFMVLVLVTWLWCPEWTQWSSSVMYVLSLVLAMHYSKDIREMRRAYRKMKERMSANG